MDTEINKIIKNYFYKGWIAIDVVLLYFAIQYLFFKESFILTLRIIKGFFIKRMMNFTSPRGLNIRKKRTGFTFSWHCNTQIRSGFTTYIRLKSTFDKLIEIFFIKVGGAGTRVRNARDQWVL